MFRIKTDHFFPSITAPRHPLPPSVRQSAQSFSSIWDNLRQEQQIAARWFAPKGDVGSKGGIGLIQCFSHQNQAVFNYDYNIYIYIYDMYVYIYIYMHRHTKEKCHAHPFSLLNSMIWGTGLRRKHLNKISGLMRMFDGKIFANMARQLIFFRGVLKKNGTQQWHPTWTQPKLVANPPSYWK